MGIGLATIAQNLNRKRKERSPIRPDVSLMTNHRACMVVPVVDRVQHMDDFWDMESKLGFLQVTRRNPEKSPSTNAFWKVTPNLMKVEIYGDFGNESNLTDCFKVR